jgi:hypothetical protein
MSGSSVSDESFGEVSEQMWPLDLAVSLELAQILLTHLAHPGLAHLGG